LIADALALAPLRVRVLRTSFSITGPRISGKAPRAI
jgi:hypothetical protein